MPARKTAASRPPNRFGESSPPVRFERRINFFRTGRTIQMQAATNPPTSITFRPKPVPSKDVATIMVISASSSQPTTSLIAAAVIAITPSGIRVMLSSSMIRPSTGSAVIENAVAMNSVECRRLAAGDRMGAVK